MSFTGAGLSFWSGGSFDPNAVRFDGVDDYLFRSGALDGVADAYTGIFFLVIRYVGANPASQVGTVGNNSGTQGGFHIFRNNLGQLGFDVRGNPQSLRFSFEMPGPGTVNYGAYLLSWNTNFTAGNKVIHAYKDDVSQTLSGKEDSSSAFAIRYTLGNWRVARTDSPLLYNGMEIAGLYFAPGQFLDFSIASNRRKFITATGQPRFLGDDGSLPTGIPPALYLNGPASTIGTNAGTGGNLTIGGSPTNTTYP